jgi:hypothetical protein
MKQRVCMPIGTLVSSKIINGDLSLIPMIFCFSRLHDDQQTCPCGLSIGDRINCAIDINLDRNLKSSSASLINAVRHVCYSLIVYLRILNDHFWRNLLGSFLDRMHGSKILLRYFYHEEHDARGAYLRCETQDLRFSCQKVCEKTRESTRQKNSR